MLDAFVTVAPRNGEVTQRPSIEISDRIVHGLRRCGSHEAACVATGVSAITKHAKPLCAFRVCRPSAEPDQKAGDEQTKAAVPMACAILTVWSQRRDEPVGPQYSYLAMAASTV